MEGMIIPKKSLLCAFLSMGLLWWSPYPRCVAHAFRVPGPPSRTTKTRLRLIEESLPEAMEMCKESRRSKHGIQNHPPSELAHPFSAPTTKRKDPAFKLAKNPANNHHPNYLSRTLVSFALICQAVLFSISPSAATASDAQGVAADARYWSVMDSGASTERVTANTALLDYAVGTINTMYYDHSGGAYFSPREFFHTWREWLKSSDGTLETRDGAVEGLAWLIAQIGDPFSKYMTAEELKAELGHSSDGFLGLGAVVEPPERKRFGTQTPTLANIPLDLLSSKKRKDGSGPNLLSATQVENLPTITAVSPTSPAERAGLTVGDRVVAVGNDMFLGNSKEALSRRLADKYSAENYIGFPDLTIAKPLYASSASSPEGDYDSMRDIIVAYRQMNVKIPTATLEDFIPGRIGRTYGNTDGMPVVTGGDSIVYYRLLTHKDTIFDRPFLSGQHNNNNVGYIRLTRFSRAATDGYLKAVAELEAAGASSYILDLRNNYGGVIQEAMLTASTLLRDPHAVLCYTMNSRGGFTPHDVEEFVVDKRYPGYLLSSEPKASTLNQVKRDDPDIFRDGGVNWVPPSSYASLHEQAIKRGIHRSNARYIAAVRSATDTATGISSGPLRHQLAAQKNIVILVNEGTASSAEVFAASLHDNGRTVALVGSKTYGKGLIQHTFRMPDGGGLRLTVAEFLTPALHHVTNVGGAQFDQTTGEWVGGGIQPDLQCDNRQGIPSNVGADLCVGVALDALQEADDAKDIQSGIPSKRGGFSLR